MDELFEIDASPDVLPKAARLFATLAPILRELCPGAEVHHVGGTAITGVPTKGDLDVQVRLPARSLEAARAKLSRRYRLNAGGFQPPDGFSFEDKTTDPSAGIHLTAIGGQCDVQWVFTALLDGSPALRDRYRAIKENHAGRSMSAYRDAKAAFFEELAALPRFAAIRRAEPVRRAAEP
jgi:GrpB-like predicted nucleotidyltransferase (UPF0157 family)